MNAFTDGGRETDRAGQKDAQRAMEAILGGMWKQKTKPVTVKELQALRAVRRQAEIVRSARARCNEIVSVRGVRSPKLDGMPKGNWLPCGLDGSAEQAEKLLEVLKREEQRLRRCRSAAQKVIDRLPPALYGFSVYYYVDCMSVQSAARMLGRSERSCWEYKAFIEQAGRGETAGGCAPE